MNWADYLMHTPQTLDERRMEASSVYRKEKLREYSRKYKQKLKARKNERRSDESVE